MARVRTARPGAVPPSPAATVDHAPRPEGDGLDPDTNSDAEAEGACVTHHYHIPPPESTHENICFHDTHYEQHIFVANNRTNAALVKELFEAKTARISNGRSHYAKTRDQRSQIQAAFDGKPEVNSFMRKLGANGRKMTFEARRNLLNGMCAQLSSILAADSKYETEKDAEQPRLSELGNVLIRQEVQRERGMKPLTQKFYAPFSLKNTMRTGSRNFELQLSKQRQTLQSRKAPRKTVGVGSGTDEVQGRREREEERDAHAGGKDPEGQREAVGEQGTKVKEETPEDDAGENTPASARRRGVASPRARYFLGGQMNHDFDVRHRSSRHHCRHVHHHQSKHGGRRRRIKYPQDENANGSNAPNNIFIPWTRLW